MIASFSHKFSGKIYKISQFQKWINIYRSTMIYSQMVGIFHIQVDFKAVDVNDQGRPSSQVTSSGFPRLKAPSYWRVGCEKWGVLCSLWDLWAWWRLRTHRDRMIQICCILYRFPSIYVYNCIHQSCIYMDVYTPLYRQLYTVWEDLNTNQTQPWFLSWQLVLSMVPSSVLVNRAEQAEPRWDEAWSTATSSWFPMSDPLGMEKTPWRMVAWCCWEYREESRNFGLRITEI